MMGSPVLFRSLAMLQAPQGIFSRRGYVGPFDADLLVIFAFVATLVYLRMRVRQRKAQAQADLQKQLIDKFSSGRELSDFLATPGGQKFIQDLGSQSEGSRSHILRSLRSGIVLTVVGASLIAVHLLRPSGAPEGFVGVILLAIGVGLLISTGVSHRLTKQWSQNPTPGPGSPPPLS